MMNEAEKAALARIISDALEEDVDGMGLLGDATSQRLIPAGLRGVMALNAREALVAAGAHIPALVFAALGANVVVEAKAADGETLAKGQPLAVARGQAQALLTGERVALNLMQRACAVATLTRKFVDAVAGTKAVILDTRKTMPGLRALDKYAVRAGGGENHRMGLYDMVLVKDNHIALAGGVAQACALARQGAGLPLVVECDTLAQVEEALKATPDRILLDNMGPDMLAKAVAMTRGKVKLEASGGVNLATVRAIAESGVDYISVGALTHSAAAVDIGADIVIG
ncbi:MAG: carboxylating nicotinate-nucleotide diphosphorylase [Rickettsiales bacterium]|nr:carboxylating nicotinate-nucleotide diphosphorylase [Rickettsiales bacterium]